MRLYLLLILCFSTLYLTGQNVQWAYQVVNFSSEYSSSSSDASEVLGPPNAENMQGKSEFSWAPKNDASNSGEYIKVRFSTAIRAQQIAIHESLNPGSISKIILCDSKGKSYKVYENKTPKPVNNGFGRVFYHKFSSPGKRIIEAKIVMKTKAVKGWNQIDAIAISDSRQPIKPKINNLTYTESVPEPESLGMNVNSGAAERLPIISPDGKTLFFTRKYHPENIGGKGKDDIWVSQLGANNNWSRARNIGPPLNNEGHNFVISVSPNARKVYLGNEYRGSKKDGVSVSSQQGQNWTKPKSLNIEKMYNDDPFVSYNVGVNGNVMLLAIKRSDSYGDRDLYVSFRKGDRWSAPMNLGPDINTLSMEASVFLAADGKTIYFTSAGHPGYGGLDIYRAQRLDSSWKLWTTPQNLGSKINSKSNDYNYTIPASGDYAYFASGDVRNSDLYRIQLPKEARPEPVNLLKGRIVDATTNQPINSTSDNSAKNTPEKDYQIIIPQGEDVADHTNLKDYYPVSEPLEDKNESIEEVDYDGNDPKLIAQNTPSRPKVNTAKLNQDRQEVEKMRKRLQSLQQDISQLEDKRKPAPQSKRPAPLTNNSHPSSRHEDPEVIAMRKKLQKANAPTQRQLIQKTTKAPDYSVNNPTQRPPNSSDTPNSKTKEDPELVAMRKKLQRANAPTEVQKENSVSADPSSQQSESVDPRVPSEQPNTRVEDPEVVAMRKKLQRFRNNETPQPEITAEKQERTKPFDPELEEMRKKLAKAKDPNSYPPDDENAQETIASSEPAPKYDSPAETGQEDYSEVRHWNKNESREEIDQPTQTSTNPNSNFGDSNTEKDPSQNSASTENPYDNFKPQPNDNNTTEAAVSTDYPSREELEADLRQEIEQDLKEEVKRKLRDEMMSEVKDDLIKDLENDVKQELKDGLEDRVAANLRQDLKEDVENDLRDDLEDDVRQQLKDQMRKEIEEELRNTLAADVENELRDQMKDQVRDELKTEMEYQLKKDLEVKLRRELTEKIRRQMKNEARDKALAQQPSAKDKKGPTPLPEYREIEQDIKVIPIKVGQVIPMNNIFFDANEATLKEASFVELNRVADFLNTNNNVVVEIGGHTNGWCSDEFALPLSKNRSIAVRKWLIEHGINKDRIQFRGYGKTKPVASNDTLSGRKKNQRVEMTVLEILD